MIRLISNGKSLKIQLSLIVNLLFIWNCCHAINIEENCPRMLQHIFDGFAPIGKAKAGNYTEFPSATQILPCVAGCCEQKATCNVAFIFNQTCYHVECSSNELCLPINRPNMKSKLKMVLVNPISDDLSWLDVLKVDNLENDQQQKIDQSYVDKIYLGGGDSQLHSYESQYGDKSSELNLKKFYNQNYDPLALSSAVDQMYDSDNDLQMEESKFYTETNLIRCEIGRVEDSPCLLNEKCAQLVPTSPQGVCKCIGGYSRNNRGQCVNTNSIEKNAKLILKQLNDDIGTEIDETDVEPNKSLDSTETSIKKLTVSVVSKNVRLPDKEVTLSVYTLPDEATSGDHYKYLWSLISQPSGDVNGTMSDQTKDSIKLSNLSEGLYRFKVVVSGTGVSGEAYANVTVSPEKRINTAPIVIITPTNQTLKLPTSKAILDGSTSKDDDKIVLWHWDLIQGPIGYQPVLPETSTLQLTDLTSPGNYTFRLNVTDSDNVQNSTIAYIQVLKANDYKPEANAGADVIVYLPHNNVTLNGSQSTDDRGIVAWEWTKDSTDESKAVDMQNTRTPYLQLSNLEEGMYTFVLKVTDASDQSSTATVHVFVKPPTNLPPIADAGQNVTINLPQTWSILNGSLSTDDIRIISYDWKQLDGPSQSNILNGTNSIANATGMTIGRYLFQLNVMDENRNNGTDLVTITVVQEKNTPPIANAGGDQSIFLPINSIYLNGTKSSDDLGIVNYTWTRDGSSLAIGTIVGNSSRQPVLILSNIVPGRYVFKLTVTDAQGLTGTDTVSIIVHPDPFILDIVELTFTVGVSVLTQSEVDSLEQKLMLLLGDNTRIHVRDLKMEQKTGEAVLIFYVEKVTGNSESPQTMAGIEVEKLLNDRFWKDNGILGTLVSDVRTQICQNKCSFHGMCNSETRACMCETFWMPDVFYFWGIRQANCDWSILYVVIGVFLGFLCISGCCWGLTCMCRRTKKTRTRTKPQKYALLGTQDDEIPSLTRGTSLSDSDTDSDVVFENRSSSSSKQNGILRTNGNLKNGNLKTYPLGRRVKT